MSSTIDVSKIAQALRADRPIESLITPKIRAAYHQVAKDVDPQEYAKFRQLSQASQSVRAGRFASSASEFVEKRGDRGQRAAFMILALERAGHQDAAVALLKRVFSKVAPKHIKEFSASGN